MVTHWRAPPSFHLRSSAVPTRRSHEGALFHPECVLPQSTMASHSLKTDHTQQQAFNDFGGWLSEELNIGNFTCIWKASFIWNILGDFGSMVQRQAFDIKHGSRETEMSFIYISRYRLAKTLVGKFQGYSSLKHKIFLPQRVLIMLRLSFSVVFWHLRVLSLCNHLYKKRKGP